MSIQSDNPFGIILNGIGQLISENLPYPSKISENLNLKENSENFLRDGASSFLSKLLLSTDSNRSFKIFENTPREPKNIDSSSDSSACYLILPALLLVGAGFALSRYGFSSIASATSWKTFKNFLPKLGVGLITGALLSACSSSKKKPETDAFRKGKDIHYLNIESYERPLIENWAGNSKIRPQIAFCPKNHEEVVKIIKDANEKGKSIGMRGAGHAWGPLVEGDYLISNVHMKEVSIDSKNNLVTVGPGATIAEVDEKLKKQNLIVPCDIVGTIDIPYPGIMATGGHGASLLCNPLSDSLVEVEMVLANGETKIFKEGVTDSKQMNAVRLHLGMFGMMTKMTFKIEKRFNADGRDFQFPVGKLFDRLPEILSNFQSVEVLWFPGAENVIVKGWNRTHEPITKEHQLANKVVAETRKKNLEYFDTVISRLLESSPEYALALIRSHAPGVFPPRTYRMEGFDAMHYADARKIPIRELEIGIPFNGPKDLKTLKRAWEAMLISPVPQENGLRGPNVIAHIRFSKGSTVPMSPAYKNELTAWMDYGSYYLISDQHWNQLTEKIWKDWAQIQKEDGVKFKLHHAKDWPETIQIDAREMYGAQAVDDLNSVRQQLDPQGRFLNPKMKARFRF